MEQIRIEEPCKASWRKMTPAQEGRFCGSCQKVVVDFTKKTNEEIAAYFLAHGNVCGKYRVDQVETPALRARRKRWRWLATALIFVFGASFISSCRKHMPQRRMGAKFMIKIDGSSAEASSKRIGMFSFLIGALLFSSGCIMGKRYDGGVAEHWPGEAVTPPAADSIVIPEGKQPE